MKKPTQNYTTTITAPGCCGIRPGDTLRITSTENRWWARCIFLLASIFYRRKIKPCVVQYTTVLEVSKDGTVVTLKEDT